MLVQRYCLHEIPSMFYINVAKYEIDMLLLCETTKAFIDAFSLFQTPFSAVMII